MLIINGTNLFPSRIEEVVMSIKEAGNNYLIVVEKEGVLGLRCESKWVPQIYSGRRPYHRR
jgi:phenylacetate-coenzyme A ligase PaaK-like adenylate-forming protein